MPNNPTIGTSTTTPPEEFAESINGLVDKTNDADKLEVAAAKAYCNAEKAYGQRSMKLSKVIQMTGEHFTQKYLTLLSAEGKVMPTGEWGLVHALNTAALYHQDLDLANKHAFEDKLYGWLDSSFCEVAEKQVPSAVSSNMLFN